MATVLPYIKKDIFGGPAGSTRNSMQTLITGILQGAEKRRKTQQQNILSETIGGLDEGSSPEEFANAILSNSKLNQDTKNKAIDNLTNIAQMGYYGAQSDLARRKPTGKNYEISYWNPKTGQGGKVLASEGNYNKIVQQLENDGLTVQKPETKDQWSEPYKAGNTWVQKNETTGRVQQAYSDPGGWSKTYTDENGNTVQRNINTGEIKVITKKGGETEKDMTNKITLGNGQKVSMAEMRAQYRQKMGIPDDFSIQMMEMSDDPTQKQIAARYRAILADDEGFNAFMRNSIKNGLEWTRPKEGSGTIAPPPGFEID